MIGDSSVKVWDLVFDTVDALYRAYMPFILKGALFVRTDLCVAIGEQVILNITLPDKQQQYTTHGQVVWVTPARALGARYAGVGVEFGEESAVELRDEIKICLHDHLSSSFPTDTM